MASKLSKKERDHEDLLLFREMYKRERDTIASLLQPDSDEFETTNGNYALYRISSGKKGSARNEHFENGKNDFNWLKTPPATPLFPSLEMETKAPELVVQREIPILQPLSRFAGSSKTTKESKNDRPKSPNPKLKPKVPLRSTTPTNQRTIFISSAETKNNKPVPHKATQVSSYYPNTKRTDPKKTHTIPTSDMRPTDPFKPNLKNSSSIIAPQVILGFSNKISHNLRTSRSTSATRHRYAANVYPQKLDSNVSVKTRRQSCSPSITRGRKPEFSKQESEGKMTTQKGKVIQTQVLGSKMVDKVMNARKLSGLEDRGTKPKVSLRERVVVYGKI